VTSSPRSAKLPCFAELSAPAVRSNPYPFYQRWREQRQPIIHDDARLLVLVRHADCAALLGDPQFGHAGNNPQSFLELNPPDHGRLRGLAAKLFTAPMTTRLAGRIEQITAELIDNMLSERQVDLIESMAAPMPVAVISDLLGIPESDRGTLADRADVVIRGVIPAVLLPRHVRVEVAQAHVELVEYFRELVAHRRRDRDEDLVSRLVGICDQGDVLTENELLQTCVLMFIAGHETTASLIGNGTLALLRNPGQFARLRTDPGLVDRAVEELLRYDSPTQVTFRHALRDASLNDLPVPMGWLVAVVLGSANRDPKAFAEPDRLDIGRKPSRHLAFGRGIHFCLGASLARLEARIAFRELARRVPHLQLAGEPVWTANVALRGLARLPVTTAPSG
jgi:cytochrome P450